MTTRCSSRAAAERGATLLEVLFSTALTAVTLVVFFIGTVEVTRTWVETRPMVYDGTISAGSLELLVRSDMERASAAWAWDGSLRINGAPFAERTWGMAQPLYEIAGNEAARTSLAAWYGSRGKVFTVAANASGERTQSCLVLGADAQVIAAYESRLTEGSSNGKTGLWLRFSRWQQPAEALDPALVRTSLIETFRAGASLSDPCGPLPALANEPTGLRYASLSAYWTGMKQAFQSDESLLEGQHTAELDSAMQQLARPRLQR